MGVVMTRCRTSAKRRFSGSSTPRPPYRLLVSCAGGDAARPMKRDRGVCGRALTASVSRGPHERSRLATSAYDANKDRGDGYEVFCA